MTENRVDSHLHSLLISLWKVIKYYTGDEREVYNNMLLKLILVEDQHCLFQLA